LGDVPIEITMVDRSRVGIHAGTNIIKQFERVLFFIKKMALRSPFIGC
jgi:hypothetical protein